MVRDFHEIQRTGAKVISILIHLMTLGNENIRSGGFLAPRF